ncbi:MAG: phosphate signaling complex protein PhoU [Syntrophomonadaceae bacterium]|nr:phosphate signaling complex protein PhoU [Syntrophomonadaceae bacterium]
MVRGHFDKQLELMNAELVAMGDLIETAIAGAVQALIYLDAEKARETIEIAEQISAKEREIESFCLKLLLQQQPVARDLRLISTALKMITDMERIGDQASNIAELGMILAQEPGIGRMHRVERMAEATIRMVNDSVDAFVQKDMALAQHVIDYDDVVDDLFSAVKLELITLIRESAAHSEQAINWIMVAKYLEKIADHAANIAAWAIFSLTGEKPLIK